METYITPGLIANASTLGVHWIYDAPYLLNTSKKQSLLFLTQNETFFKNADVAYFSYPNHVLGDVTVQGEILKWLYRALEKNPSLTSLEFSKLLYQKFKPGGSYVGFVESYAKRHVTFITSQSLNLDVTEPTLNDDHLVGFMPYLACKELQLDAKKAFEFTQVYSKDFNYLTYFYFFDDIILNLKTMDMQKAIKKSLHLAPLEFKESLLKAIEMTDTDAFIEKFAGRACAIKFSIPVIIHVLYHSESYESAVLKNARIGGAVSDRNTLVGALYAQVSSVPLAWREKVIDRLQL